jgi:hypothetical protein
MTAKDEELRRQVVIAIARTLAIAFVLVIAYFNVPLTRDITAFSAAVFVGALALLGIGLTIQVRRIMHHPTPRLRAAETLGIVIPAFIMIFALLYAGMAQADPANFTQPVNRLSALYFTVTVLSTVGFGDIAATTETTRAIVTIQMLLDLVLIGVVVKVVIGASRVGMERLQRTATTARDDPIVG